MNIRLPVGIAVVCTMLYGGVALADTPTGNTKQGESVYRTHCLNCHKAKGQGDGPVADSLTPYEGFSDFPSLEQGFVPNYRPSLSALPIKSFSMVS